MQPLQQTVIVGVIGTGTMGAGIAEVAAAAGHPVRLFDARTGAAADAIAGIAKRLARDVEKGRLGGDEREALLGRLTPVETLEDLASCGLVIEAIVEDLEAKCQLFTALESLVSEEAIFATNTSSISVTAIGAALSDPARLVGMHFFNPAPRMALVEVVSGLASGEPIVDTIVATARAWGKSPVRARSTPGFIVNRVARPFYAEALRALAEGAADVPTIDAAMKECGGFRMGPFELMDLIGNDVNAAVTQTVYDAFNQDRRFEPSLIQREMVAARRLGRKSGQGFYDHREGAPHPVPATAAAGNTPTGIKVFGELGVATPLLELAEAAGLTLERNKAPFPGAGWIVAGGAALALCDGRSATGRAAQGLENLVLFDLALDYRTAGRMVLAPADGCDATALADAVGFMQALGKQVSVIDDYPGLLVMRTVCMLANLGADAVHQQVCDGEAVDVAMQKGVNYPRGPLAWAEQIGLAQVVEVLDNLTRIYGEERYRVSPLLRRKVWSGGGFSE